MLVISVSSAQNQPGASLYYFLPMPAQIIQEMKQTNIQCIHVILRLKTFDITELPSLVEFPMKKMKSCILIWISTLHCPDKKSQHFFFIVGKKAPFAHY